MLASYISQYLAQCGVALQPLISDDQVISALPSAPFAFSDNWSVLGPFQIGTREAPWGADPLEYFDGFHALEYESNTTYRSSLVFNGTVSWSNHSAQLSGPRNSYANARLSVNFPEIDWELLQSIYGFAGVQWQGWARGEIYVRSKTRKTVVLTTQNVLECWIGKYHYFGGDFFNFGRAPVTLHLDPGVHRIEVRLVRDVRSMGGFGKPSVDIVLEVEESTGRPRSLFDSKKLLMADVVGGDWGPLVSPYASTFIRNDAEVDMYVHAIEGMGEICEFELLSEVPVKIVPGQTRPIGFRFGCVPSYNRRMNFEFKYRLDGSKQELSMSASTWLRVLRDMNEPHRITFLHPSGVVSWAMLRPPPSGVACGRNSTTAWPVLLVLHGAGTSADNHEVDHAFDTLPDLCAWILFPEGGSSWCADDWHTWGFADVEAAVSAIPDWIEQVDWRGPGVDINRWLVTGHSNGGQGVWYALTHRPDKIVGAAALSHYSSIQNYVPYTFWRTADPGKTAVVQAALNSYRHDLLLENAKDIPVVMQHGSEDRNAPAYHSRLMHERTQEAGADSTYFEVPGRPHFWDGVLTTKPLSDYYEYLLGTNETPSYNTPHNLRNFSIVVANPGDMGPKNGLEVLQLDVPGQLGSIHFTFHAMSLNCSFSTSNVLVFRLPLLFSDCSAMEVDGKEMPPLSESPDARLFFRKHEGWTTTNVTTDSPEPLPQRQGRQLGSMDAILRTSGTFSIVRHSKRTEHIALQISRNLFQYFSADSDITDDYEQAIVACGSVISVAIGSDLRDSTKSSHPIEIKDNQIYIRDGSVSRKYSSMEGFGLAALFVRPLPNERLELVVWAADARSLKIAARLVPMMTGSGQPDFIVADKRMLWKGVDGALALGFFDTYWNVSRNAFFT